MTMLVLDQVGSCRVKDCDYNLTPSLDARGLNLSTCDTSRIIRRHVPQGNQPALRTSSHLILVLHSQYVFRTSYDYLKLNKVSDAAANPSQTSSDHGSDYLNLLPVKITLSLCRTLCLRDWRPLPRYQSKAAHQIESWIWLCCPDRFTLQSQGIN